MENILNEPLQVHSYFKEYLDKVLIYKDIKRKSVFIRYFNINKSASIYKEDDIKGTFDHYNSGVFYDIYDYTPGFSLSPITNTSTDKADMGGMIFDSLGEITVYTINEPRMGDLISFPYGPSNTDEVFRVIQIDVSIYARDFGIRFHKLTLEYAPIKDLKKLNILNNFVYDISKDKNISQLEYINKLEIIKKNKEYIESIKDNFSHKYELYYLDDGIAPLELNCDLYNFLSNESYQDRFFDLVNKPYGIKNYDIDFKNKAINISNGKLIDYSYSYIPQIKKI